MTAIAGCGKTLADGSESVAETRLVVRDLAVCLARTEIDVVSEISFSVRRRGCARAGR